MVVGGNVAVYEAVETLIDHQSKARAICHDTIPAEKEQ